MIKINNEDYCHIDSSTDSTFRYAIQLFVFLSNKFCYPIICEIHTCSPGSSFQHYSYLTNTTAGAIPILCLPAELLTNKCSYLGYPEMVNATNKIIS